MEELFGETNLMLSNPNLQSMKDQLDGSLTNLFDSLNRPLHENKFDLTQKINDNFKDILQSFSKNEQYQDAHGPASTPSVAYQNQNFNTKNSTP